MSNFIEDFYFGNADPQNRDDTMDRRVAKELSALCNAEDALSERLSEEEKQLFLQYIHLCSNLQGTSNLHSFVEGFRLGARFTYDTFVN